MILLDNNKEAIENLVNKENKEDLINYSDKISWDDFDQKKINIIFIDFSR